MRIDLNKTYVMMSPNNELAIIHPLEKLGDGDLGVFVEHGEDKYMVSVTPLFFKEMTYIGVL